MTGEHIQPPFYGQLFDGFLDISTRHGVATHGPLDSRVEPGNDGSLTLDGEQAVGFDISLGANKLPKAIIERGIDRLDVGSYPSTVIGGNVWPERVWVDAHESSGLTRSFTLRKAAGGEITAKIALEMDPSDEEQVMPQLSEEQEEQILHDLLKEKDDRLRLLLSEPSEPDIDDVEFMRLILAELGKLE